MPKRSEPVETAEHKRLGVCEIHVQNRLDLLELVWNCAVSSAEGRTRTGTSLRTLRPERSASTNSTTPAERLAETKSAILQDCGCRPGTCRRSH